MKPKTKVNPEDIKGSQILIDALYSTKTNKEVKDMWVDNYFGYEEEIWDKATAVATKAATEKVTKATMYEAIKKCFINGISKEQISKIFELSSDEIAKILKETKA